MNGNNSTPCSVILLKGGGEVGHNGKFAAAVGDFIAISLFYFAHVHTRSSGAQCL